MTMPYRGQPQAPPGLHGGHGVHGTPTPADHRSFPYNPQAWVQGVDQMALLNKQLQEAQSRAIRSQHQADAERVKWEEETATLHRTLQAVSSHLEREKVRSARLESELAESRAEVEGMRHRFEAFKQEQATRLQASITEQREEFAMEKERLNEHYRLHAKELEDRDAAHEREMEALRVEKEAEISQLQAEKAALKEWLDRGVDECRRVAEEVTGLKEQLQAAEETMTQLSEDKRKLEETVDVLMIEVRESNDISTHRDAHIKDSERAVAMLQATISSMQAEGERLAAEVAKRGETIREHELAIDDIRVLAAALRSVAKEYSNLKALLELKVTSLDSDHKVHGDEDPEPLVPTTAHEAVVDLECAKHLLQDCIEGLQEAIRAKLEQRVVADEGLTQQQIRAVRDVLGNPWKEGWGVKEEGARKALPARLAYNKPAATDLFARLEKEWDAKEGDVLDELLANIESPEGINAFDVFAEAAATLRGTHPPYPGLTLVDLLLLRLYTMASPDLDALLLHDDVPTHLSKAWHEYREKHARNRPSVMEAVGEAMQGVVERNDEKAWTAVRKWLKTIGLLMALGSVQSSPVGQGPTLSRWYAVQPEGLAELQAGGEAFLPAPTSCGAHHSQEEGVLVHIKNAIWGRPLKLLSQYPNEDEVLVPPGTVLEVEGVDAGHVVLVMREVFGASVALQWANKCRADSEAASLRLERALAKRGIAEAVEAINERIALAEARHASDVAALRQQISEQQAEVESLAETTVRAQRLSDEMCTARDEAQEALDAATTELMQLRLAMAEAEKTPPSPPTKAAGQDHGPKGPSFPPCEKCGERRADVECSYCQARLCGECSNVIHSTGVLKTHPIRVLHEAQEQGPHVDLSGASEAVRSEVQRLQTRYSRLKEKCRMMKMDWAKMAETRKQCQQLLDEKTALQQYIKKLEVENDSLRRLTAHSAYPPPAPSDTGSRPRRHTQPSPAGRGDITRESSQAYNAAQNWIKGASALTGKRTAVDYQVPSNLRASWMTDH